MKLKHHIFRIIATIAVCTPYIIAVVNTESWFWIGVWSLVYYLLCGLIIHIDAAHEYKDL